MEINIKVDQKKLGDLVTVDDFIELQEGNIKTLLNVLSLFLVDGDGVPILKDEARKMLGKLTLNELKKASAGFTSAAENAAVPLPNGSALDSH